MLTKFECPDGQKIDIKDCLSDSGCLMKERCMPRSLLLHMAEVREWKGVPSVTQLLKGTYESMMSIITEYAETPDSMIFRILGTNIHNDLDKKDVPTALQEGGQLERMVSKDGISGLPDILETEGGRNILVDYKVTGAYKVKKALGLSFTLEDGEEVYKQKTTVTDANKQKIVRLKGERKLIKKWYSKIEDQDAFDWVMQLNYYRLMFIEHGIPVDELMIQAIVRDGGMRASTSYGVEKKTYKIPIPILPEEEIRAYFVKKRADLLTALEYKDWNEKCTEEETWGGMKCDQYCSVRHVCKFNNE